VVAATLTGTTNQVVVTNGAGTITLSLPQNIHTGASPTFLSATLTGTTNQLVLGTTNTVTISASAPAASRTYTIADPGGNVNFVMDSGGALTITNTATTNFVLTATGANTATWQSATASGQVNYAYSYDTRSVTYSVNVANSFVVASFNNGASIANGWTYTRGLFTAPATTLTNFNTYISLNNAVGSTVACTVRLIRNPTTYSTGTASQTGTTVTGVGTTWIAGMVGGTIVFANQVTGYITARSSNTVITVSVSQSVGSQAYTIIYAGTEVPGSAGNMDTPSTFQRQIFSTGLFSVTAADTFAYQVACNTAASGMTIAGSTNGAGTAPITSSCVITQV
jgi:frataxin-like iron-binding protein CyaY